MKLVGYASFASGLTLEPFLASLLCQTLQDAVSFPLHTTIFL